MVALAVTLHVSIAVQAVTSLVGALALLLTAIPAPPVPPLDDVWKLLLVEMTVQAIEFVVYVTWIRTAPTHDMARVRYFDWFVTTPMMLFTNAAYMAYEADQVRGADAKVPCGATLAGGRGLTGFFNAEAVYLAPMAAANLGMLLVGYAGEVGTVPRGMACVAGFVAMAIAFGILWQRYARHSPTGRRLFVVLTVVWSLYGVAFMTSPVTKNSMYNGLDVVAKNLFGLFLAFKLVSTR